MAKAREEKRMYGEDRMINIGFRATADEVKTLDKIARAGGHRSRSEALRALIRDWNNPIAQQIEELQRLRGLIENMAGMNDATLVPKLAKRSKVSAR